MKIPKSVAKLLENKYVLYIILFLAVTNLLGYMVMGSIAPVIFFIIVGYLVSIFSKNMIIVLLVPLLLTSILMAGSKAIEGFDNPIALDETVHATTSTTPSSTTPSSTTTTTTPPSTTIATKKQGTVSSTPLSQGSNNVVTPPMQTTDNTDAVGDPVGQQQQGMTTMYHKKNNRIDYAATVEDAYEDLNKILGGDGIKRLTDDTQRLMGQQIQLADAMKSMTPLLEQAKGMLQGFDLKNLDGLASMAKQFANTK
jgi:cytoskeletal protein RodZ